MSRKSYEGESVTVSFDPEICQHSGVCVKGLGSVFDTLPITVDRAGRGFGGRGESAGVPLPVRSTAHRTVTL